MGSGCQPFETAAPPQHGIPIRPQFPFRTAGRHFALSSCVARNHLRCPRWHPRDDGTLAGHAVPRTAPPKQTRQRSGLEHCIALPPYSAASPLRTLLIKQRQASARRASQRQEIPSRSVSRRETATIRAVWLPTCPGTLHDTRSQPSMCKVSGTNHPEAPHACFCCVTQHFGSALMRCLRDRLRTQKFKAT